MHFDAQIFSVKPHKKKIYFAHFAQRADAPLYLHFVFCFSDPVKI